MSVGSGERIYVLGRKHMPAQLAYKPPAQSHLIDLASCAAEPAQRPVARQHPSRKFLQRHHSPPALAAGRRNATPRRARLPPSGTAGPPAPRAGVPALGAGHRPAAGAGAQPATLWRIERSELSPWAKASLVPNTQDSQHTPKVSFITRRGY